jgi:hypothetical protein
VSDTAGGLKWLKEEFSAGCVERSFVLSRRTGPVPGAPWSPGTAIDGPYHGDRVPSPMAPSVYQQLIVEEGIERVTARMTEDWLETVSTLAAGDLVHGANVSVFGISMGARFGLPVAAALGSRLRCAAIGKFGIRESELLHPGLCAPPA